MFIVIAIVGAAIAIQFVIGLVGIIDFTKGLNDKFGRVEVGHIELDSESALYWRGQVVGTVTHAAGLRLAPDASDSILVFRGTVSDAWSDTLRSIQTLIASAEPIEDWTKPIRLQLRERTPRDNRAIGRVVTQYPDFVLSFYEDRESRP